MVQYNYRECFEQVRFESESELWERFAGMWMEEDDLREREGVVMWTKLQRSIQDLKRPWTRTGVGIEGATDGNKQTGPYY